MELTASLENYLEAIAGLCGNDGHAHSNQIADHLEVKRSSVTVALRNLAERGLIHYKKYEPITLTDRGRDIAWNIQRRHDALSLFLQDVLGVNEQKAERAACEMEHAIGEDITERLVSFVEFVRACPRAGEDWLKGFEYACRTGKTSEECTNCIKACIDNFANTENMETSMVETSTTLDTLKVGDKATVVKIGPDLKDRRRYAGMGLIKGSDVEVVRVAPLGDPIVVKVKGYELSLRKEEAVHILVS